MNSYSTIPVVLAVLLYPIIFIALLPPHPSPLQIATIRESLSAFHCTFTTILCLFCLYHHDISHLLSPPSSSITPKSKTPPTPTLSNASLPLITLRSPIANAVTAYETGYILADTLIVLYARHVDRIARKSTLSALANRGLRTRHLLTHHIPLLLALLLLQLFILAGRERGVLVIMLLMLQNLSSPFGTLRWYLGVTRPPPLPPAQKRWTMLAADVCYICAYAICRVGLLYWIVARFASIQARGVLEGFWSLKWHCQLGMLGMGYVNVRWLVKITRRAVTTFRAPDRELGSQKQNARSSERKIE